MASHARHRFGGTERFEILRCLGEGGMGAVYEAIDHDRGERVALKTLNTGDPQSLLRFKNEFRTLAELTHPNLCALGELIEHQGQIFFTMELVRGVDFLRYVSASPADATGAPDDPPSHSDTHTGLRIVPPLDTPGETTRVLAESGKSTAMACDERRLRAAARQLALAIDRLHRAGKVHRDIKPTNILVTDTGRVVLLDFGLVSEANRDRLTDPTQLVGTVAYMAPEQGVNAAVGPEADWYSLGVLLYTALTGSLPASGTPAQVLRAKRMSDPAPPSSRVTGIPADLDALVASLLRRDPASRPPPREILAHLDGPARSPASEDASDVPLVGRRGELRELRRSLGGLGRGNACAVLVHGESGYGKSALVKCFGDLAESHGTLVLRGRCHQRESVSYKALDGVVDALAAHLGAMPDEQLVNVIGPDHGHLCALFPVMRRISPLAGDDGDDGLPVHARRALGVAALRELLARLAGAAPLLVIIDDLQWADSDSLALLTTLLQPPRAPMLMLTATVRTDADGALGVDALLESLPCPTRTMAIGPLPPAEARALAESLADGRAVDVDAVLAETGGHPLFIDALVRYRLLSEDTASLRLDQALWWRARRLEAPAREMLELLCVAGHPLRQAVVAQATTNDAGHFSRTAASLVTARLARTTGNRRTDVIEPFHDRVRQAVDANLDAATRKRWHGRLALALEADDRADPEELAAHWESTGEAQRAARYLGQAASRAMAALAFDHAARLRERQLELDPASPAEVRVALGDALANAGRGAEAAGTYLAAATSASPADALELRRRAAEHLLRSGHLEAGMQALDEVLGAVGMSLPRSPRRALLRLVGRRLLLRMRGLRYRARSVDDLTRRQITRIDVCWSAAASLSLVCPVRGSLFQSYHLALALRAGERYRVARALGVEACYSSNPGVGARRRTEALIERASQLAEEIGEPYAIAWAIASTGVSSYLFGDWRRAAETCARAEAHLRQLSTSTTWETNTMQLFALASRCFLGELAELQDSLPARIADAERRGDLNAAINLRSGHVNIAWLAADDPDRARAHAERAAQELSRDGVFFVQHYYDLLAQTHIDLYRGDAEAAHDRVEDAWPHFASSLLPRVQQVRAFAVHLRGRTALAAAAHAGSAWRHGYLRLAARCAKRLRGERAAWIDALALSLEAGISHVGGSRDRAMPLLASAIEALTAVDMHLHAAAVRRARAELLPGPESVAELAEVDGWLRARGVHDPARFVRILCTGFDVEPTLLEARSSSGG